jgi:hypothetical protein
MDAGGPDLVNIDVAFLDDDQRPLFLLQGCIQLRHIWSGILRPDSVRARLRIRLNA